MTSKAIDISAYQGVISAETFRKMKGAIPSVVIRCSYTKQKSFNMYKDKCFEQNITNAHKAGMNTGVYHYSQAVSESEAISEAKFVLDIIRIHKSKINLPVAFDWEFGGRLNSHVAKKMGKQRCKQICDAFCRTVKQAGFDTMVYANLYTLDRYISEDIYKSWKVWVAQYAQKCDYRHDVYMWQYTSGGKVSGINGRVDMNWLYKDGDKQQRSTYAGRLPTLPERGWFTSGDRGVQVKLLQVYLNWYFGYERLNVDGVVGRLTMDAVKDFERAEHLTEDGAFGEKCLKAARIARR